jgi:hypothetical protein
LPRFVLLPELACSNVLIKRVADVDQLFRTLLSRMLDNCNAAKAEVILNDKALHAGVKLILGI